MNWLLKLLREDLKNLKFKREKEILELENVEINLMIIMSLHVHKNMADRVDSYFQYTSIEKTSLISLDLALNV